MNDQISGTNHTGHIYFDDGINLDNKKISTLELTTRVGMIFQKPSPFPMSIYENVAYGPKSHGIHDKKTLDGIVEKSLKEAAL
jgi:phosphate transport system ATP-binding protein